MMTDHMLIVDYSPESGWSTPVIKPYAPLELDPACSGDRVPELPGATIS